MSPLRTPTKLEKAGFILLLRSDIPFGFRGGGVTLQVKVDCPVRHEASGTGFSRFEVPAVNFFFHLASTQAKQLRGFIDAIRHLLVHLLFSFFHACAVFPLKTGPRLS